tara:strand:+ start:87 stop:626 length:540 start_codon:yes stop_codon:yes gene_type:complete
MLKKKQLLKTPSQTVGPFFSNYLQFNFKKPALSKFIKNNKKKIILNLNVKDKKNNLVNDAFIEYWQVSNFNNKKKILFFNRVKYNTNNKSFIMTFNEYKFKTHIFLTIFSRGLLNHLNTIIFFDDLEVLLKDEFFNNLPLSRRNTMIAKFKKIENNIKFYKHDLYLSGVKEAVFFNFIN